MTKYQEPIICRSKIYKKFIRQERNIDYKFPADLFLQLREDNDFEFFERVDYLRKWEQYYLSYEALNRFYELHIKLQKRYKRIHESMLARERKLDVIEQIQDTACLMMYQNDHKSKKI